MRKWAGPWGPWGGARRPHAAVSLQAAEKLGRTQLVKFQTRKTPQLLLSQDGAQAAQLIVLDLFPTNEAQRPLFTLGIVSVAWVATWGSPVPVTQQRGEGQL